MAASFSRMGRGHCRFAICLSQQELGPPTGMHSLLVKVVANLVTVTKFGMLSGKAPAPARGL